MTTTTNNQQPRTEGGFARSTCACDECSIFCHYMPGQLAPSDLKRMAVARNYSEIDVLEYARRELLASEGSIVKMQDQLIVIPTIVPEARADGSCIYLSDDSYCTMHAVSPYGCAFFDSHFSKDENDRRSRHCLNEIIRDVLSDGLYSQTWIYLYKMGRIAQPAKFQRFRMHFEQSVGIVRIQRRKEVA